MGKLFLLISFVLTFILIIRVVSIKFLNFKLIISILQFNFQIFPHDEETYRTAIFLIEHEEEEKFNKLNEWDLHPQQNIDLLDINLKVFILAELNSFILLGLNLIFFKIITYFFENFKSSSNSIVHENGKVSILKFFITSVIAICKINFFLYTQNS